jgi:ABC-type Fe3+-hydroxamate transport system substrate-binding protein
MTVGGDTFINDILKRAGLQNVFEHTQRYPAVTAAELKNSHCQLLLLSSEPYPFKQQHMDELQQYLPGVKVMLVDGEMFSWYGSRMLNAAEYLFNFINLLGDLEIN